MSALGIIEASSDTILTMMKDLGIENSVQKSIVKKIMNIAVGSTYYTFCRRNKTVCQESRKAVILESLACIGH